LHPRAWHAQDRNVGLRLFSLGVIGVHDKERTLDHAHAFLPAGNRNEKTGLGKPVFSS
jgi:hypothetical protein